MARNEEGSVVSFDGEERFLSNFWIAPIMVKMNGETSLWQTTENVYQAAKLFFVDDLPTNELSSRIKEVQAMNPGQAKRFGSELELNSEWNDTFREELMFELSSVKYFSNLDLAEKLVELNHIEEGNNWGDTFFGVDLETGEGENILGEILMDIAGDIHRELEREKAEPGYLNPEPVFNFDDFLDFAS